MTDDLDRGRIVDALVGEWAEIDAVLDGLTHDQWEADSPCPGWRLRDVVAHLVGTERMLLGEAPTSTPEDLGERAYLHNDIGRFNELWVDTLAALPPAALLGSWRATVAARSEVLRGLDDDAWNKVGFTPAGQNTHGRFMRIRVFDCWLHELDLRDAAGLPDRDEGVGVAVSLDEMVGALGFVVGKLAGLSEGQSVTFNLTGADGRVEHVAVIDGKAASVEHLDAPTAMLTMRVGVFARLAGGRTTRQAVDVQVTGDVAVGEQVLAAMNYTI